MNGAPAAANESGLPTVTVFGAGIAGLTTAHELVERGFPVQVVELQEDDFKEYECAVGGLAANQFTRVRAPLSMIHDLEDEELGHADKVRRQERKPQRTHQRFPILQSIRFSRRRHGLKPPHPEKETDYDRVPRTPYEPGGDIPVDWRDYWDNHGVHNRRKLGAVLETIRNAAVHYRALYFPKVSERFALGSEPGDDAWGGSADLVNRAKRFVAREILVVRIIGYTDTDGTAEDNRALASDWAGRVRQELIDLNQQGPADLRVWRLEDHLDVVVVGSVNPRYDQSDRVGRSQSNRVEFEVVEQVIPGEHGFRFFPAFYRHLFDTMRRTPVLDANGKANGETAFNQLIPTPQSFLALDDGKGLKDVNVPKVKSLLELNETLKLLCEQVGFTLRDLVCLQYFTLRYLISCPERRETLESMSLLDYIGGDQPEKRLSAAAIAFLDRAPRALAAMSATDSDVRTQADILIQLIVAPPADNVTANMTLNGPTSVVWLDHWKAYLKIQGVKFFVGKLNSLLLTNNHFIPDVSGPEGWSYPCPEDAYDTLRVPRPDGGDVENHRFVLATSFQKASDLVRAASATDLAGPFKQLDDFNLEHGTRSRGRVAAIEPDRDPATGKQKSKSYPLRTISGLQYFFPQQYRFGAGNIYFVSAPWALTAISQFAYWRQRVRPVGPFLGQISVDVGDWHSFYPPSTNRAKDGQGNTAWYSSSQEVADNTWAQVKDGLEKAYAHVIDPPTYFHIDRNLIFADTKRSGFMGSALLHISQSARRIVDFPGYALKFSVTNDEWSRLGADPDPMELPFSPAWRNGGNVELTPEMLASTINRERGDLILAAPFRTRDDRTGVLVSPRAYRERIVIAFRPPATEEALERYSSEIRPPTKSDSGRRARKEGRGPVPEPPPREGDGVLTESNFCFALDNEGPWLIPFSDLHDPLGGLNEILEKYSGVLEVKRLRGPYSAFELRRRDGHPFRLGVGHICGAVEILDGPQLEVVAGSDFIQVINTMYAPSGLTTAAAVRANAIVGIPSGRRHAAAPNGLEAGRLYGIGLGVGTGSTQRWIRHIATSDDTHATLRDALLKKLQDEAGDLVIVEPHDWRHQTGIDMTGIVMSPISALPAVTINILGDSNRDFLVVLNRGALPAISGRGKRRDQIRDEIAVALAAAADIVTVTPLGEHGLSLKRVQGGPEFTIAVLNVDRKIELLRAPALAVEVKDLHLLQADEGYAVLRNDAEFLINIPGQWKARPGLSRGDNAKLMPTAYPQLAMCFGNADAEIYYGHPDQKPLEYWVGAGTYMATYTRLTTMEAANESGRHAAAALIYKCLPPPSERERRAAQGFGLVGDFPQIFKIEECEPDDLKFSTNLDRELFRNNLPHVLDILSVTESVNALLESKLPDNEIRQFVQDSQKIVSDLQQGVNLGVRAGGQAFSRALGLVAALAKKALSETPDELGILSNLQREVLTRLDDKTSALDKVYSKLWEEAPKAASQARSERGQGNR